MQDIYSGPVIDVEHWTSLKIPLYESNVTTCNHSRKQKSINIIRKKTLSMC